MRYESSPFQDESRTNESQAYFKNVQSYPLHIKMLTTGSLAAVEELVASWIAQDRNRNGHYFTSRVPKMFLYGGLVAAPMAALMTRILNWMFKNATGTRAKIFEILISNLIVSVSQRIGYYEANMNRSPQSKIQST